MLGQRELVADSARDAARGGIGGSGGVGEVEAVEGGPPVLSHPLSGARVFEEFRGDPGRGGHVQRPGRGVDGVARRHHRHRAVAGQRSAHRQAQHRGHPEPGELCGHVHVLTGRQQSALDRAGRAGATGDGIGGQPVLQCAGCDRGPVGLLGRLFAAAALLGGNERERPRRVVAGHYPGHAVDAAGADVGPVDPQRLDYPGAVVVHPDPLDDGDRLLVPSRPVGDLKTVGGASRDLARRQIAVQDHQQVVAVEQQLGFLPRSEPGHPLDLSIGGVDHRELAVGHRKDTAAVGLDQVGLVHSGLLNVCAGVVDSLDQTGADWLGTSRVRAVSVGRGLGRRLEAPELVQALVSEAPGADSLGVLRAQMVQQAVALVERAQRGGESGLVIAEVDHWLAEARARPGGAVRGV